MAPAKHVGRYRSEFNMDVFHELRGLQRSRCSNPKRNSHREHWFQNLQSGTRPGLIVLAQGAGSLTFDIDVETLTASGSSNIELELTVQAVVFSVPATDAKLEFLWGSEDKDSSIEATIPLVDILMVEPEVEGSDVYLAVHFDCLGGYRRWPWPSPSR